MSVSADGIFVAGGLLGDAFLRRYDAEGSEIWTRQFGSEGADDARDVSIHATSVYVVGDGVGPLPGQSHLGQADAFLRKYDPNGNELWTRQFGTTKTERGRAVAADSSGAYVTGITNGTFPDAGGAGGWDGYLRKYDHEGIVLWTSQFGTPSVHPPAGGDRTNDVAVHASGVYVAGRTAGIFPGQPRYRGSGTDAFLTKYDLDGDELWLHQFGNSGWTVAEAVIATDSAVYAAGWTNGVFPGETFNGTADAFLRKYAHDGTHLWTRQFGTNFFDRVMDLAANETTIFATGETGGALGGTNLGEFDAFATSFDPDGNLQWAFQFGTNNSDRGHGIAAHDTGLYVAGATQGQFENDPEVGPPTAFFAKVFMRETDSSLFWIMAWGVVAAVSIAAVIVLVVPSWARRSTRAGGPPEHDHGNERPSSEGRRPRS